MEEIDVMPTAMQVCEAATFERLFRAHYSSIERLIQRVIGDAGVSEEIAAEVFVKLLQRPGLLKPGHNVLGWLYRTATHAALDHLRKLRRREQLRLVWERFIRPGNALDPHKMAESAEQAIRVRSVLLTLRSRDVQMLVARSLDTPYSEIAEAAGVQPSSVGALLARAELTFEREYLKRYGNH